MHHHGALTLMEVGLMNFRHKRITTAMSLFLVFAVGQVYLGMSLAATKSPANLPAVGMPQATAILTTQAINRSLLMARAP